MKTILITGHDTQIGKTQVASYIAKTLSNQKKRVQIIKPVETGVDNISEFEDTATILKSANPKYTTGFTLNSFKPPLAPLSAAALEEKVLSINNILQQINNLPKADWRLIETAGGLAVPLDNSGADARDLAMHLKVDFIVLVIQNRLGAINQARLLDAYTPKEFAKVGFWLNDVHPRDHLVTKSNLSAFSVMDTPLWAHLGHQQSEPDFCIAPFLTF